jgi:hypothetical protein
LDENALSSESSYTSDECCSSLYSSGVEELWHLDPLARAALVKKE